jgi:Lipid A 3-O-deacylase (PagL)
LRKVVLFVIFLSTNLCSFAQLGRELAYGYGRIIPTNQVYPEIKYNSSLLSAAAVWQTSGNIFRWAEHYNFPLLKLNFSYQWLGNDEVLGNAFGILPSMSFYLKEGKSKGWKLDVGTGIAFLDNPYHAVNNPENNVYGSKFNFFFSLGIAYEFELKKDLAFSLFAKIPHYSASNLNQPNLGINTFSIGTAIRYLKRQDANPLDNIIADLPDFNKKIRPFVRVSYGLSRTSLNGPKHPSYVLGVGVNKLLNRYSRINSGFEYVFNSAKYNFIKHTNAFPDEEFKKASRYSWYLGYELLFGHVGFLAEAGIYLNDHYGKQSIFTTKLGLNYYPRNTILHSKLLPYFGAYVRAYAGEADFFEMTAGFNF